MTDLQKNTERAERRLKRLVRWLRLIWRTPFVLTSVLLLFGVTLCLCMSHGWRAGLKAGTAMFEVDVWDEG